MLIAARNAMLAGAALPYDAEVEYLESTGTQWIDTGVFPFSDGYTSLEYRASTASNLRSIIVGNLREVRTQGVISSEFGGLINIHPYCPRAYVGTINGSPWEVHLWGDAVLPDVPVDVVVSFIVSSQVLSMSVNGGTPQTVSLGGAMVAAADTLALFKDYRTLLSNFANSVRIYHMDISSESGYIRRFIPVRFTNKLGNSEGAMYDRVSGELFRNSGTGAFVIGPDK